MRNSLLGALRCSGKKKRKVGGLILGHIKQQPTNRMTHLSFGILLPSARLLEERLTVSQSVSQAVSQAVSWASRQADRQAETHSLAFFSGRLQLQTVGNCQSTGAIGGQVVDHSSYNRSGAGRPAYCLFFLNLNLVQILQRPSSCTAWALRAYCARRGWDTHPRIPVTCLVARRSSKAHMRTTKLPSTW